MQIKHLKKYLKDEIINLDKQRIETELLALSLAYMVAVESENIRAFESDELALKTVLCMYPNIDEEIKKKSY